MVNGISAQRVQVTQMFSALGLPESVGVAVSTQVSASGINAVGLLDQVSQLTNGLSASQMDNLFGAGLPDAHFIPRPGDSFRHGRKMWGHTFSQIFADPGLQRQKSGDRASRRCGRKLERALLNNPQFKAQMEDFLGGRVIADGRVDMRVTVQRYQPKYANVSFSATVQSNTQMSGIYGSLAKMEQNITKMAGGLTDSNGRFMDADTQKMADGMGMKQPLAFEDVMFLMMMKYGRKKEKDLTGKMNELSTKSGLASTGSTYGGNAGRPSLEVQYQQEASKVWMNPSLNQAQKLQALQTLGQQYQVAKAGGPAAQSKEAGVFGNTAEQSDTLKQMQLQKMMEDLKKMYEMLSNIMKSMHNMQMTAIRNLK